MVVVHKKNRNDVIFFKDKERKILKKRVTVRICVN